MIRVDELVKAFGEVRALDGVGFAVRKGEVVALRGPNGSGKSTVLRLVAGLARPSAGRVSVGGHDPWREPREARRLLSYLPQQVAFPEGVTGREVLLTYARLRGVPADRMEAAAGRLGLEAALDRRVGGYSGGMVQRLGLAVVVGADTPVLLLDEPERSLDAEGLDKLRTLFSEWRAAGKAVLFSTHSLGGMAVFASRAIRLEAGRVEGEGLSAYPTAAGREGA